MAAQRSHATSCSAACRSSAGRAGRGTLAWLAGGAAGTRAGCRPLTMAQLVPAGLAPASRRARLAATSSSQAATARVVSISNSYRAIISGVMASTSV